MTKTSGSQHTENAEPHWIEWLTGLLSAVIVVVVITWIGKDAVVDRDSSPDLQGVVLQIEKRSQGFQVMFEMRNNSSATASDVTVTGKIVDGETVVETIDTVLSYVPGHSRVAGGVIFQTDPAGKKTTIKASAYSDP